MTIDGMYLEPGRETSHQFYPYGKANNRRHATMLYSWRKKNP